jgi:hypothetical protein
LLPTILRQVASSVGITTLSPTKRATMHRLTLSQSGIAAEILFLPLCLLRIPGSTLQALGQGDAGVSATILINCHDVRHAVCCVPVFDCHGPCHP